MNMFKNVNCILIIDYTEYQVAVGRIATSEIAELVEYLTHRIIQVRQVAKLRLEVLVRYNTVKTGEL